MYIYLFRNREGFFILVSLFYTKFMKTYIKVVFVSIIVAAMLVIILKEFGFDSSAIAIAGGVAGGVAGALASQKGGE